MIDISKIDYSVLDSPRVSMHLFHPRSENIAVHGMDPERDIFITVDQGVNIGACFYTVNRSNPNILFFHGNGEIAGDYYDVAQMYNQMGINFLPVDYRGYGRSDGIPCVTSMMKDCHVIFEFTKNWLKQRNFTGPLIVMGRSLGSASALELAHNYKDEIDALIIESGFAFAVPLLRLLGVDPDAIGFEEKQGFRNIDKIVNFTNHVLIIHAEYDHIIPFTDGQALFDACKSKDKYLVKIKDANHNDIMYAGLSDYMTAIKNLTKSLLINQERMTEREKSN